MAFGSKLDAELLPLAALPAPPAPGGVCGDNVFDVDVKTDKLCSCVINGEPPRLMCACIMGDDGPCNGGVSFIRNIDVLLDGVMQNESFGTDGMTAKSCAIFPFSSSTSLSFCRIKSTMGGIERRYT